jgi:hypothetical protein
MDTELLHAAFDAVEEGGGEHLADLTVGRPTAPRR